MFDFSNGSYILQMFGFCMEKYITSLFLMGKILWKSDFYWESFVKGPFLRLNILWRVRFWDEKFCEGSVNGPSFTSGQTLIIHTSLWLWYQKRNLDHSSLDNHQEYLLPKPPDNVKILLNLLEPCLKKELAQELLQKGIDTIPLLLQENNYLRWWFL